MFHRLVYEKVFGEIPNGFDIHHICENRKCHEITHLEALSRKDHRRKSNTKLTKEDVYKIRQSKLSNSSLAKFYGVSDSHISRIRSRIKWK